MAINKKKLTKKVWYENELWDVVWWFEPNKDHTFLILMIDDLDGLDAIMIDANNDEFYPNTKQNSQIMKEMNRSRSKIKKQMELHKEKLLESWLSLVED